MMKPSILPPALARHYDDDACPWDCPYCAELARVDAILKRADGPCPDCDLNPATGCGLCDRCREADLGGEAGTA